MATANQIADYILTKVDRAEGDSITHLKLQKLVYYCQAWYLALHNDEPLFDEDVCAWAHGPVINSVWQRFKNYGWQAIDPQKLDCNPFTVLRSEEIELAEEVWAAYGHLSGSELRALTHSEDPWKNAYGDTPPGDYCDAVISREAMGSFYRAQL